MASRNSITIKNAYKNQTVKIHFPDNTRVIYPVETGEVRIRGEMDAIESRYQEKISKNNEYEFYIGTSKSTKKDVLNYKVYLIPKNAIESKSKNHSYTGIINEINIKFNHIFHDSLVFKKSEWRVFQKTDTLGLQIVFNPNIIVDATPFKHPNIVGNIIDGFKMSYDLDPVDVSHTAKVDNTLRFVTQKDVRNGNRKKNESNVFSVVDYKSEKIYKLELVGGQNDDFEKKIPGSYSIFIDGNIKELTLMEINGVARYFI